MQPDLFSSPLSLSSDRPRAYARSAIGSATVRIAFLIATGKVWNGFLAQPHRAAA